MGVHRHWQAMTRVVLWAVASEQSTSAGVCVCVRGGGGDGGAQTLAGDDTCCTVDCRFTGPRAGNDQWRAVKYL